VRLHPHAPLLVRVACYEGAHSRHVQEAKAHLLKYHLFEHDAITFLNPPKMQGSDSGFAF